MPQIQRRPNVKKRQPEASGSPAASKMADRKYVGNRSQSYCDRIIKSPSITSIEYTSVLAQEYGLIQYSDHDAVYSIMTVNGLRILVITWNAGNITITSADEALVKSDWAEIISKSKADVVFFTLQEMAHKDATMFLGFIAKLLPGNKHKIANSNSGHILSADKYTVSALLSCNSKILRDATSTSLCLHQPSSAKTVLCTKSIVSMSFWYKAKTYTIIGAHFPFKSTDTVEWGNPQRIIAMQDTLNHVIKDIKPKFTILTGDLNFRTVSKGDQLKILLSSKLKLPMKLDEADISQFSPTCKRVNETKY
jgi:hypothetical protein